MKWTMSIPNVLSSSRIAIAASFPFLPSELRILFLIIALLTEYLDGALARRFGWVTNLGQFLDPVADRLLAFSVGLTLVVDARISLAEFLLLFFRDMSVTAGFFIYIVLFRNFKTIQNFRPNLLGKLTTVFQYLVFFHVLLSKTPNRWIILTAGSISAASAVWYAITFLSTAKGPSVRT